MTTVKFSAFPLFSLIVTVQMFPSPVCFLSNAYGFIECFIFRDLHGKKKSINWSNNYKPNSCLKLLITYKIHPTVQSLERKTDINQIALQVNVMLQGI